MEKPRHREYSSNADKYDCPRCYNMNGERNLSICMTCKSGDKFIPLPTRGLEFKY